MKFYFFRHGQTDWNKVRRIQGHSNIPLNEQGKSEATELSDFVKTLDLEIVYSSDLDRAFETAQIATHGLDLEIIKEARLREANFGDAEGRTIPEIVELFGNDLWEKFMKVDPNNMNIGFPGGETRADSIKRMRSFIDEVRKENQYERVGISTHGGVVRNLLGSYILEHSERRDFDIPIPNCVCYELAFEEGKAVVTGPLNK